MRKLDTNVSPSFQHGIAIGLNVTETPRCSRCDDDRDDVRPDWQGTHLCAVCRERVRATEDAGADE